MAPVTSPLIRTGERQAFISPRLQMMTGQFLAVLGCSVRFILQSDVCISPVDDECILAALILEIKALNEEVSNTFCI